MRNPTQGLSEEKRLNLGNWLVSLSEGSNPLNKRSGLCENIQLFNSSLYPGYNIVDYFSRDFQLHLKCPLSSSFPLDGFEKYNKDAKAGTLWNNQNRLKLAKYIGERVLTNWQEKS